VNITARSVGFALAFVLVSLPARSQPKSVILSDGNKLLSACQSKRAEAFQFCDGSIQAYFDTLSDKKEICPGASVTEKQARDIAISYLVHHPEERHRSAASIARTALERAFPCGND
jgi:hypothetical protein